VSVEELNVRGHWNPVAFGFEIFVTVEPVVVGGLLGVMKPLEVEHVEPGVIREPTLKLTEGAAEALMADLWNAGIRPRGAREAADLVEALKTHRDDAIKVRDQALGIALAPQPDRIEISGGPT
jgi:hypothetical protein